MPQWLTLATVLEALCELADLEFEPSPFGDPWGKSETRHDIFQRLWNDAMDEDPDEEPPPF